MGVVIRPPHFPPETGEMPSSIGDAVGYLYGSRDVAGFGCRQFFVAQIPRRQAVDIILSRHYSGRIVNNSYVHQGIFLDGKLLGVMQWGYALNPARADKVVSGTNSTAYLELNRMWLDDLAPRNSESRALSYAIKYFRKAMPWVAWLQSFADERCGKYGVVYQAANFLYVGAHKTRFYELNGQCYHEMLLTAHRKGGQRGAFLREHIGHAKLHVFRQFRYVGLPQKEQHIETVHKIVFVIVFGCMVFSPFGQKGLHP